MTDLEFRQRVLGGARGSSTIFFDWLKADKMAYIDTGLVTTDQPLEITSRFMRTNEGDGTESPILSIWGGGNFYWSLFFSGTNLDFYVQGHNTWAGKGNWHAYELVLSHNGVDTATVSIDGETKTLACPIKNPLTLKVFTRGDKAQTSYVALSETIIKMGEGLPTIMHLLPCYKDGVVGFWDLISNTMLVNDNPAGGSFFLRNDE